MHKHKHHKQKHKHSAQSKTAKTTTAKTDTLHAMPETHLKHIDHLEYKSKEQRTATMQQYHTHDRPNDPPHSWKEKMIGKIKARQQDIPPWSDKQQHHRGRD